MNQEETINDIITSFPLDAKMKYLHNFVSENPANLQLLIDVIIRRSTPEELIHQNSTSIPPPLSISDLNVEPDEETDNYSIVPVSMERGFRRFNSVELETLNNLPNKERRIAINELRLTAINRKYLVNKLWRLRNIERVRRVN